MNDWLAQMYNTNGATEEMEKQAQMDLFCKLAADQNIDLSQMSEEEIEVMYSQVFAKEAAEGDKCDKCDKAKGECSCESDGEGEGGEKTSAAVDHWMQKRASQEKISEADMMGRVMAHSFTQELDLIKEAATEAVTEAAKEAATAGPGASYSGKSGEKAWAAQAKKKATEDVERKSGQVADSWAKKGPGAGSGASKGKSLSAVGAKVDKLKGFAKSPKGKAALIGAGVAAGGAAAYGGYKALKGKKKAASVEMDFEDQACLQAVKTAGAAGYNLDQAIERVDAVQNLGLDETEKVAHAAEFEDAVHVRGLEYLEAAGYPINWDEIFGE